MRMQNKDGAILIISLWIITILTALCVSVAHRSAIALKLSSYQTDKVRAELIARAGIMRALAIKNIEYEKQRSINIDAISEQWGNNPDILKKHPFKEGFYTLSYLITGEQQSGSKERGAYLYGLSDEASRLNINEASVNTLMRLLVVCGQDESEAEKIAYCIVDWRDEDNAVGAAQDSGRLLGAEENCKNDKFQVIEELLLVKGVTPEILNSIRDFITIYTDGKVNINTAPYETLSALFGADFPDLADRIAAYRRGRDRIIGTRDDRWFSQGPYIVERGEEGLVEVKNLNDGDWLGNVYGITTEEYNKIKSLMRDGKLATSSKVYRTIAEGEFKKVIARVEAVYEFSQEKAAPLVRFWYQE